MSADVELRVTCPIAPLQIEGTIDRTYVYYRDRHARWTVGFGESPEEALSRIHEVGESDYEYRKDVAYQNIIDAYRDYVIAYL